MRNYSAYHLLLRKRSDRVLEKVKFFPKPPRFVHTHWLPNSHRRDLREDIAMRGIGLDFGGGKIEGGIDHTRFQRIKVRGAGHLPCPLAFGKTLRVRERASDALQKLHGKGLCRKVNARTPAQVCRRYWRFYRCSPRKQQSMSITIMAMIRPGRASQIRPFKTELLPTLFQVR